MFTREHAKLPRNPETYPVKLDIVPSLVNDERDLREHLNMGNRVVFAGYESPQREIKILVGTQVHADLEAELGLPTYPPPLLVA